MPICVSTTSTIRIIGNDVLMIPVLTQAPAIWMSRPIASCVGDSVRLLYIDMHHSLSSTSACSEVKDPRIVTKPQPIRGADVVVLRSVFGKFVLIPRSPWRYPCQVSFWGFCSVACWRLRVCRLSPTRVAIETVVHIGWYGNLRGCRST